MITNHLRTDLNSGLPEFLGSYYELLVMIPHDNLNLYWF